MAIYFGQSIAEKLIQADAYYAADNHLQHLSWEEYTDDEKKAALNQAEREINLYCGIDLESEWSTTDWPITDCENFRPDYAIFEHAYFILDNTVRRQTALDGVVKIESEEYQEEEKTTGVTLSPQAQRYLKFNRTQVDRAS